MKKKLRILKINRAKWRTGSESKYQTGEGNTELANEYGFMCCLGFCANQLGRVPIRTLTGEGEPADAKAIKLKILVDENGSNTPFSKKAMRLNDNRMTPRVRELKIKNHFLKSGIAVRFSGKYITPNPSQ